MIKKIVVLLLCLSWLFVANFKAVPLNSLGELLTYRTGLMSLSFGPEDDISSEGDSDVDIQLDSFGIPYIFSLNSDADVAYGLGYMHARDRFFQMELIRGMVKGELAALFGARAIPSDTFWIPFQFAELSREVLGEYQVNQPELYDFLEAYTNGVNTYLAKGESPDPLYKLFAAEPKEWAPEDCLLVTWYMSKNLAYFDYHLERQELIDKLSPEELAILYPMNPTGLSTILPPNLFGNTDSQIEETVEKQIGSPPVGQYSLSRESYRAPNYDVGSNNWAISAAKTAEGHPIIANDPHLFLTLPAAFYETRMKGPGIDVYGYTIPGVPVVVSGHNDQIAWGITSGEWDLVDAYLLEVRGDSAYYLDGDWVDFEEETYSLPVRGQADATFTIRKSVHGIVHQKGGKYLTQKWHAGGKSYSVSALFDMMQSTNWDEFSQAMRVYDYPPQNFIYSDVNDTIGIICAGKLPLRPEGYQGQLLDGRQKPLEAAYADQDFAVKNPEDHYLFSANQQPLQNGTYFGMHWHKDDYRVQRIDSLLKSKDGWTLADVQAMQLDEVDQSFFHLRQLFSTHASSDSKYSWLAPLFNDWDGNMSDNSKEAYHFELLRESIESESKHFAEHELSVVESPSVKSFVNYLLQINDSKSRPLVERILVRADSSIVAGQDAGRITYADKDQVFVPNLSFLPGFGNRVDGLGGNKNTINMRAKAMPVFRSVFLMSKEGISGYSIMAGGQSGRMDAQHYNDQLALWQSGQYKVTQFPQRPEALKGGTQTINLKR